ncbi:Der GTPase-activating protein YihI [Zobellella iuensis]|uniref:Der GTPase-activating protein YihI n=1 Tax=Zobellella iuensis TaxID=2803811 RepID=A0ABS1QLP2_9GAMM|nr:Der GTPase-activating protein YihI [Zobellella iuensis]MBL1375769.1 GTPase-activating protein [Zobellella iuensis]
MTRIKKARTPGQLGARKESRENAEQSRDRKRKAKRKGLAPGSRHNQGGESGGGGTAKVQQDPRLGSKKPIPLIQDEARDAAKAAPVARVRVAKPEALTPEQELDQLENNERLNTLLDRVDAGDKLGKEDAAWLDQTLARHQQLLEQLGLLDDEDEEPEEGDDLWTRFMDADLDPAQYQEKEDKS